MKKTVIFENKIMKNEANLNKAKFTVTSCGRGAYSVLQPETQNGTNPNEANLKPIPNTLKPSLFSGKGTLSRNLFLRNKANFNHPNITPTPYDRVTYSYLQPNPKNGTNPNKANLKPIFLPLYCHLSTVLLSRANGPHPVFQKNKKNGKRTQFQ